MPPAPTYTIPPTPYLPDSYEPPRLTFVPDSTASTRLKDVLDRSYKDVSVQKAWVKLYCEELEKYEPSAKTLRTTLLARNKLGLPLTKSHEHMYGSLSSGYGKQVRERLDEDGRPVKEVNYGDGAGCQIVPPGSHMPKPKLAPTVTSGTGHTTVHPEPGEATLYTGSGQQTLHAGNHRLTEHAGSGQQMVLVVEDDPPAPQPAPRLTQSASAQPKNSKLTHNYTNSFDKAPPQTIVDPHGETVIHINVPAHNININSGSGQQNINGVGEKPQPPPEPVRAPAPAPASAPAPAAGPNPQPAAAPARGAEPERRRDDGPDRNEERRMPDREYGGNDGRSQDHGGRDDSYDYMAEEQLYIDRGRSPQRGAPPLNRGRSYSPTRYEPPPRRERERSYEPRQRYQDGPEYRRERYCDQPEHDRGRERERDDSPREYFWEATPYDPRDDPASRGRDADRSGYYDDPPPYVDRRANAGPRDREDRMLPRQREYEPASGGQEYDGWEYYMRDDESNPSY